MRRNRSKPQPVKPEMAAGNGLLDRRLFLQGGGAVAAALGGFAIPESATAAGLPIEPWMTTLGPDPLLYDRPSRFEKDVVRGDWASRTGFPGVGSLRTPHHLLTGTITPNGLFFTRCHTGIPDIDPDKHRLLIHGLVKRPLIFSMETLARYPMESRIYFLECGGNGELLYDDKPTQVGVRRLAGQVGCAEWTGVKLSILMDEAGVDPKAKWVSAEGADAVGMTRSIPLSKIMDDAFIALYQNGERLMPSNGYPMRLFLPGFEGNMQVKYLRRIRVSEMPTMSRDETSKYTLTRPDGKSSQFNYQMEAKSVITQPSPDLMMKGPGFYEISGLAWSAYGKVAKVDVSADGGKSWAPAALQQPVLSLALTRFRLPWQWDGRPVVLQSRVTDEPGYVQPTREQMIANRGRWANYHANCIISWGINEKGEIKHVYA
jgi:sulfane dehydrogenase subunit SoxC